MIEDFPWCENMRGFFIPGSGQLIVHGRVREFTILGMTESDVYLSYLGRTGWPHVASYPRQVAMQHIRPNEHCGATRGLLLDMVRRAFDMPYLTPVPGPPRLPSGFCWYLKDSDPKYDLGPTLRTSGVFSLDGDEVAASSEFRLLLAAWKHRPCAASTPECSTDPAVPRVNLAERRRTRCHANNDGECSSANCPQLLDGEPARSGRHCPLDTPVDPADG